jgi:hypothetical protein
MYFVFFSRVRDLPISC